MEVEYITRIPSKYYTERPIQDRVEPCNVKRRRKKMTITTSTGTMNVDIEGFGTKKSDCYRWSTPEEVAEYLAWVESVQPLSEARRRVEKAFQEVRNALEAADVKEDITVLHELAEYLEGVPSVDTTGLVRDLVFFTRHGQSLCKEGWRKESDKDRQKAEYEAIVERIRAPEAVEVSES